MSGVLPVQWEIFAAEVASGSSCVEAAVSAGYSRDYAEDLIQRPEIRARIEELSQEHQADKGVVPKIWIECQLVRIARDSMDDVPAQIDSNGKVLVPGVPRDRVLARQALMDLARLKGYIVERKLTAAAKMSLGNVGMSELNAMLDGVLLELAPGERARIKELARGKNVARGVIDVAPETTG